MPSDSPVNNASHPGNSNTATDPDHPSSVNEWIEIGRLIERQIRRDVARVVGADKTDDWSDVRDTVTGRIRERAVAVDTGEIGQRAERIAHDAEEQVRTLLAQAVGAERDADWPTIGRTMSERLRQTIDPNQAARPGGSGTSAGTEDAAVPAARPSPDSPPRPAHAGGAETVLPTVTEEAGEPPRHTPLNPS